MISMLALMRTPRPPLSAFVKTLWYWDGAERPHAKERLLPDGAMALVVNLAEDEVRIYDRQDIGRCEKMNGAVFVGAQREFFVIDTVEQRSVVGVAFRAGGAFPFLRMPATEVEDMHLSLDMVWGRAAARELRERLLAAPAPQDKLDVMEAALLARAARRFDQHPAVTFALSEFWRVPHTRTISEVTDQIGLSPRRFIQVFSEQVGLTPKVFCRVRRFQEAIRLTAAAKRVEWADVALACGYFDQAHFIRDFHAFSGLNPSTYLAQRGPHTNHVPIDCPAGD